MNSEERKVSVFTFDMHNQRGQSVILLLLTASSLAKHKDVSCATFDTGFTDRIYTKEGALLEGDGPGYRYRLRVFINPEKSNCGLEEESQTVRNFSPRKQIGCPNSTCNATMFNVCVYNN